MTSGSLDITMSQIGSYIKFITPRWRKSICWYPAGASVPITRWRKCVCWYDVFYVEFQA